MAVRPVLFWCARASCGGVDSETTGDQWGASRTWEAPAHAGRRPGPAPRGTPGILREIETCMGRVGDVFGDPGYGRTAGPLPDRLTNRSVLFRGTDRCYGKFRITISYFMSRLLGRAREPIAKHFLRFRE